MAAKRGKMILSRHSYSLSFRLLRLNQADFFSKDLGDADRVVRFLF